MLCLCEKRDLAFYCRIAVVVRDLADLVRFDAVNRVNSR